ncbi:vWA domain-containing protein [Paraliomyxa miuraensis]|uniref:vWA domain-containing protein n=1 Tax=Paraliomyxa miuraensis TaxID=376150 RepID=UPI00225ACCDC|nr:vWA domain-containing protein [Paraliomyxa miuraensis]MCX4244575.1 VWA domain-containing protein [Paraliomyxa miuraensis]
MHASFISRLSLLVGASVALPSLFACLDHPLKPVEYEAAQEKDEAIALTVNKDVDILFVIDNSGSMGEEQATLAQNFASFINVLERPEVEANYRIGVTTTDNGNPWCGTTGPEAGKLRLSSCLSRPTEFVFNGAMTIDAFDEACVAVCPDEWSNIEIQPTEITQGGESVARPWLENIEGKTNLPEGLSTVQAFQCFGPQGIDGCGFESHLESMWKSLRRSQTDGDEAYGFVRNNAILSIVHVTDEADCSYNNDHEAIFLPEGNRVFWSDPDAASPTSAVCWNAGVACDGNECYSVNLDESGAEVSDSAADSGAVLRPLERYIDIVQTLETQKQEITPDQEVLVAVIGGVNSDGSVTYQESLMDPQFQADFGVGPGCESSAGRAVPPVRLREFAEEFQVGSARNMFSICDADYSPALEAIAEAIADQVKPACMPACVADGNPTTPEVLDPSCTLIQEAPQADGSFLETSIRPCVGAGGDELPDGADVCYQALVGDAMDEFCIDEGFNLQFVLVRRPGFPAPGGTSVSATCQLSQNKVIDCPGLP